MKRPVRDERWVDPEGREWQVERVVKWRTETAKHPETGKLVSVGPFTLAYFEMRNVQGNQCRVKPAELSAWTRLSGDPLEGRRNALSKEIGNGAIMIVAPAPGKNPVCPVKKGERYHLSCGVIVIDKITRKVVKGRDAEWHIEFIRIMKDRDYFLRSVVPGAKPDEIVKAPTHDDIQKARIDGNYKHTVEDGGDDLSVVPPEWEDSGVTTRKVAHLEERSDPERKRREADARAAIGRTLKGLDTNQSIALLAEIQRACEAAKSGALKSAA